MIHVPFYPIIRAKKGFFGEFYGACRPEKIEQSGGIGYTRTRKTFMPVGDLRLCRMMKILA